MELKGGGRYDLNSKKSNDERSRRRKGNKDMRGKRGSNG
jgi:hypothetical protein